MKDIMEMIHLVKIDTELRNVKVASSFVEWTFQNIVNEVEDIIDGEKQIKH